MSAISSFSGGPVAPHSGVEPGSVIVTCPIARIAREVLMSDKKVHKPASLACRKIKVKPGAFRKDTIIRNVKTENPLVLAISRYEDDATFGTFKKRKELVELFLNMNTKPGDEKKEVSMAETRELPIKTRIVLDRLIEKYTNKRGKLDIDKMPFSEVKSLIASLMPDEKVAESISMMGTIDCIREFICDTFTSIRDSLVEKFGEAGATAISGLGISLIVALIAL